MFLAALFRCSRALVHQRLDHRIAVYVRIYVVALHGNLLQGLTHVQGGVRQPPPLLPRLDHPVLLIRPLVEVILETVPHASPSFSGCERAQGIHCEIHVAAMFNDWNGPSHGEVYPIP